jgi:hypothetical protein
LNNGFKSFLEVFLARAKIGGDFDCRGGLFWNRAGRALNLARARVDGSVYLNSGRDSKFEAKEQVRLTGAKIGGVLECSGGSFQSSDNYALQADYVEVAGPVHLNPDFMAEGGVDLEHATITGNLDCGNGQFRMVSSYWRISAGTIRLS